MTVPKCLRVQGTVAEFIDPDWGIKSALA
jgi:hypothetical protein